MFENTIPNPRLDKICIGQAREYFFRVSKIHEVFSKIAILVRWTKLLVGWHKLNTDEASCGNPGKVGGGGVIRDCHGIWVKGFLRSIGHTANVMAEWWALRDGLTLVIQLGINQLEVELDAKVTVEMLNGADCPNRSYAPLLCDCRSLIARFMQVRVGHVFREANKCTDFLAKRGYSMTENFAVFDASPSNDLNVLLDVDVNGLYYYRHVATTLASVANM